MVMFSGRKREDVQEPLEGCWRRVYTQGLAVLTHPGTWGTSRASSDVCCYKTGPLPHVTSSQEPHTTVGKETDLERLRTYNSSVAKVNFNPISS